MKSIIRNTLGGLSVHYYFRQLLFGAMILATVYFLANNKPDGLNLKDNISFVYLYILNTFLYPYSRFVYESIMDYLLGNNMYFNNILTIFLKLITMLVCWQFAIVISPIGLIYLYFYHTRNNRLKEE